MKSSARLIGSVCALSLCLTVLLTGCGHSDPTPTTPSSAADANTASSTSAPSAASLSELGVPAIAFGVMADGTSIHDHTLSCDEGAIAKASPAKSAAVAYTPEAVSCQKLMENLNISPASERATTLYTAYSNDLYEINVFKNGNFSLQTKQGDPGLKPLDLSDAACVQLAETFLRDNDLYCDDLKCGNSPGEDKAVDAKGTVVTGKVVRFYPKIEGDPTLFGNSSVSVRINAEGQITELIYNHVHYANTAVLPLIEPEQALQQALTTDDPTAVRFEVADKAGTELNIHNIRIGYYENVMAEQPTRQPVYIFEGGEGETAFALCVPAAQP